MRLPVRFGLQLPSFELGGTEPGALFEKLVAIAQTAEQSGFDSLFVMDHLHQIPGVGPPEHRMLEGNTALAALAARTERLHLGLMVGSVTYRNPRSTRSAPAGTRRSIARTATSFRH
jgi:alkanesulfonate monooxygenase SsuD/methylene tetrahydromethanopterin reductase-like flavin-dependent oxidoreductase (luciferase family)